MKISKKYSYIFITLILRVPGLILLPIYYRILPNDIIFKYEYSAIIILLLNTIFSLQLNSALTREYFEYKTELRKKIIGSIFSYFFLITAFLIVAYVYSGSLFDFIKLDSNEIILILILIFFQAILPILQTIFRFENNHQLFFIHSLFIILFSSILTLILLFLYSKSLESILIAQIASIFLSLIFFFNKIKSYFLFYFSIRHIFKLLKYSYAAILALLGNFLTQHFSKVLIASYFLSKDFILFVVATKISIIYLLFDSLFKIYFQREIISNLKNFDEKFYLDLFNRYCCSFLILYIALLSISYPFIYLFFTSTYISAINLLPIILFTCFFEGLKNVINIGNLYKKRPIFNAIANILAGSITIFLIYSFKDSLSLIYIAIIINLATFAQSFTLYLSSHFNFKINYNLSFLIKIFLFVLTINLFSFFISKFFNYFFYYLFLNIFSITFFFIIFFLIKVNRYYFIDLYNYLKSIR